jgi:2-polyprenyl-3-methyl-5-hydroxy-6-metoxy-1,4-benzoquinol methylase
MKSDNRPKDYFKRSRDDLFNLLPKSASLKVLDVGCGEGLLGGRLKQLGQIVYGIEISSNAANIASSVLDKVFVGNVENMEFEFQDGFFDTIILGDILEHLYDPWTFLSRTSRFLKKNGILAASIPNIQYFPIIIDLLRGRFEYRAHGILDKTHLRFFTSREVTRLFSHSGLVILDMPTIYPYKKRLAKIVIPALDILSFHIFKNFLIGNIFVVATLRK